MTRTTLKHSLLALALALTSVGASAANYFVVVPVPGHTTATDSIGVTLNAATLPQGVVGEPYPGADLRSLLSVTGDPAFSGYGLKWSLASGDLPAGLTLQSNGTISGTPTASGSAPFSVRVTYKTKSGAQTYRIVVVEITVSLDSATLPSARLRRAYAPYDFKTKLHVDNDPAYDASKVSFDATGLPDGLSLSPDGLLSGTPTTETDAGASFQVVASYKDKTGQQVYTLTVNGVSVNAVQIAPGGHHTCIVTPSGGVQCWGYNGFGQLGNGGTADSLVPVDVVGLPAGSITNLSAGYFHTCAAINGAAVCWGANNYGQLGNNSASNSSFPVQVSGLASGVSNIASGYYHTCATVNGAAKCWGLNGNYQLGNNSTTNSAVPVQVSGLTSGVSIVAGTWYHTCATVAGALKCWGAGNSGQLGNGSTNQSGVPVQVSGLTSGVTSFALGANFTCAVVNGAASCWGLNNAGQLGNGTTTNSNVPVPVSGLGAGVTNITAGNIHACAAASGAAKCWGYSNHGQVGNNSTANTLLPTTVIGLATGVSRVLAGYYFNCAQVGTGVKCWGDNTNGQLGDTTLDDRWVPVSALAP